MAIARFQPSTCAPEQHVVGYEHVAEEDLVEVRLARRRLDRLDLYPRRSHVENEIADAAVLAGRRVGSGQQCSEVRAVCSRRPDLVPVDIPAAVDLGCAGGQSGEVGARSRLAEQLAPRDLAALCRRYQLPLQVL